jgi:hypothetical protein
MSSIKLSPNASGTGIFTVAAPNSNTDRTLTLPDSTGTILTNVAQSVPRSALPVGSVLQVVSSTKTDTASSTSATFVDVSGLSVSITPTSSSSKFLIHLHVAFGFVNDAYPAVRLMRDSTAIAQGTGATGNQVNITLGGFATAFSSSNEYKMEFASITHLDSPATASAITYKAQFASPYNSLASYINRQSQTANIAAVQFPVSSITVMEIAA